MTTLAELSALLEKERAAYRAVCDDPIVWKEACRDLQWALSNNAEELLRKARAFEAIERHGLSLRRRYGEWRAFQPSEPVWAESPDLATAVLAADEAAISQKVRSLSMAKKQSAVEEAAMRWYQAVRHPTQPNFHANRSIKEEGRLFKACAAAAKRKEK